MKLLLLVLFLLVPLQAQDVTKNIRDRLSKIQQTNQKMLPEESVPQPQVEARVMMAPVEANSEENAPPTNYSNRVTRLEVTMNYVQRDVDQLQKRNQELQDILQQMVITMEAQTKVSEANKGSSDRSELILNIILGIVGLIMTGGSGYFAFKKKGLVFKKKPVVDMSATNQG